MEIKFYLTGDETILCVYNVNTQKVTLECDNNIVILQPEQVETLLHTIKVMDYGFAEFLNLLEYVASQFGSRVVRIDKWYPSSQICHDCGYKNEEIKDLSIREWVCTQCSKHHDDRDRNAARNIHREVLRILQQLA